MGSVEVGFGTPEGVLSNPEGTLTIVAENARKLANGLIARRGLTSVTDLRGGTVGVSHLSEGTALLAAEMLGVPP